MADPANPDVAKWAAMTNRKPSSALTGISRGLRKRANGIPLNLTDKDEFAVHMELFNNYGRGSKIGTGPTWDGRVAKGISHSSTGDRDQWFEIEAARVLRLFNSGVTR